jgi:hypothetical protein
MNIFISIGFEDSDDAQEHRDTIIQVHKPDGTVDELTHEKGACVVAIKEGDIVSVGNVGVVAA